MNWFTLFLAVFLVGCESSRQPVDTVPPGQGSLDAVGQKIDKADSRVAAAVAVAKSNAEKPAVVRSELSVAQAYLPPPSSGDLAYAEQRAAKGDPKQYEDNVAAGKKALEEVTALWVKLENENKKSVETINKLNEQIKFLNAEVVRVEREATQNIWSLTGAGLTILAGVAFAFISWKVGAGLLVGAGFAGSFPYLINSPWFNWIAGSSVGALLALALWFTWDKVRDAVHSNDERTKQ